MLAGNRLKLLWCSWDHSGSLCTTPKPGELHQHNRGFWALLSSSSLSPLPISSVGFEWKHFQALITQLKPPSYIAFNIKHFFLSCFIIANLVTRLICIQHPVYFSQCMLCLSWKYTFSSIFSWFSFKVEEIAGEIQVPKSAQTPCYFIIMVQQISNPGTCQCPDT